jgi:YVTN family beta-propeller protein
MHELKGIPGEWHLFAVNAVEGKPRPERLDPAQATRVRLAIEPPPFRARRGTRVGALAAGVIALIAVVVVATTLVGGGKGGSSAAGPSGSPTALPNHVLLQIDPATHRILRRIPVGHPLSYNQCVRCPTFRERAMVFGDGSLWVTNGGDNTVTRIDPSTGRETVIAVPGGPSGVAFTADAVWVVGAQGRLVKIDLGTNRVVDTVPFAGFGIAVVADDSGNVWAVTQGCPGCPKQGLPRLFELDPDTGTIGPSRIFDPQCCVYGLAFGGGSLWLGIGPSVMRIDPATIGTQKDIVIGGGVGSIAFDTSTDSVWASQANTLIQPETAIGSVVRIDATDNHRDPVITAGCCPGAIALAPHSLWVTNLQDKTVVEIETDVGSVRDRISFPNAPTGVAMVGSSLWVAVDSVLP